MNDLSLNPDSLHAPLPDAQPKPSSRWKRATVAGLLSLLLPGLGQLFNRQPRRAFGAAVVTHVLSAVFTHTRLLLSFPTMVATFLVVVVWKLFVAAEAAYAAASAKKPEAAVPLSWLTYALVGVIVFLANYFPTPEHVKHESGFSAYKIPSRSMCPTICVGDRIVADAYAYSSKSPERGDLILVKHKSMDALLVKRVIGVAGDVVQPGPRGSILVNGQTFRPPAPCGTFTQLNEEPVDYDFETTKVPEGTLFVVGDNLGNSLDSRIPDFGPVTPDMVREKPLFFYWSPDRSRIGCSVR